MDAISGVFDIDWLREDLERVKRTILKRFNAEIQLQSAVQSVVDLNRRHQFSALRSTLSAEEKRAIGRAAVIDGDVMPAQYELNRILRDDVQQLLRRVSLTANPAYSPLFPAEMPCRIRVVLRAVIDAVADLENMRIRDLMQLLTSVNVPREARVHERA